MANKNHIKLNSFKKSALWRGQKIINLNKHTFDLTRIRNKLSFDYLKEIPNLTSLRTQFVHLFVKDTTGKTETPAFKDFGLFTQIEQPNKGFLKYHGLDSGGNLYKAEYFEFYRYKGAIRTTDDPKYNKAKFEEILEIKGSEDHKKLISMLEDVNDLSKDINEVIDKHFNRENYLTWMAYNIITGNNDTNSQNFFLYRPTNSNTWYFLPWDYDGAWGFNTQTESIDRSISPWQTGVSSYWGCPLHNRFLKNPANLNALKTKIEELAKIITPVKTKKFLDSYYKIASGFVKRMPDLYYLPVNVKNFDVEYKRIIDEPAKNINDFYENVEKPMPVYMGDPYNEGTSITLEWDTSYDLQGDNIIYDFELSNSTDFKKVILSKKGIKTNSITIKKPEPGVYYWKLIIKDNQNHSQVPFDIYEDEDDNYYFGVKKFKV